MGSDYPAFKLAMMDARKVQRFVLAGNSLGGQIAWHTALAAPTLWGGQDRLIPPSHGERFEKAMAGAKRVVFPQLGHVPHEEDSAQTVAAVKAFLALR